ncbi:MAG: amidohydrolase family protein [Gammaproteobacteria bacterium]
MAEGTTENSHRRELIPVKQSGKHLTVDIHAHLNVASAGELIREAVPDAPNPLPFSCPATDAVNGKMFQMIGPKLNGVDSRIADMDELGVDVQAISPSPGQYYYFAPDDVGRDASRMINDGVAEAVSKYPDRLVGMGTVPMQNTELAIAEMRRCVNDLGMRGIEISTHVNGHELAEETFRPFFAAAEELDIVLFLHPLGFSHGQRLSKHYLDNIIGNPLESTIAVSHLIFEGVLQQHAGLKLCVAHGGGYLPGYWGRMDHAYQAREDCCQHITRKPSDFLRQIWFDTLVFDQDQLDELVRTHGADKLCMGSDYPFDMAEPDPVGFHDRLDATSRQKILGANAAKLLGLRAKLDV